MTAQATLDPSQREVLVNLGNRYVVFGPSGRPPQAGGFDPAIDSELLPWVADESEVAEARIAQTLRVAGMTRSAADHETPNADVELVDADGNHFLIELKVRDRDPKARDFEQGTRLLREAARLGQRLEIWHFNVERLKLFVMRLDRSALRIDELTPLDVWEKTAEGVYTRARVAEEVDDWLHRIDSFYDTVEAWLGDLPALRCERSRAVILAEELMQKFALPDREVPVLDVFQTDQVIASFVPRGLWMIGSWGRIDVITCDRTHTLLALRSEGDLALQWVLSGGRQATEPFDKKALLALLGQQ